MKFNRTKNAKRNIVFGIINKIITLLLPFIIRMVMIREIGVEYLGLGSLFSSILQVLNLAELGFSSAVVYCMYKPIAEDDTETLCAILNFYKRIYLIIGIIIAIIGLCILPFIPKFINGDCPNDINIFALFLIYLISTVISYFLFAYKNSLITAYQRVDVISNINSIVLIVIYTAQIAVIIITKNFYLYAVILVVSAIIQNICTEIVSKKLFPQIICKGTLNQELKDEIKIKVKGLLINKLCIVSRNSFDSIFVSMFLGLRETAIYNNYFYIMNSVIAIVGIILPSILAGVGNSVVTESQQKNYADMKQFNFMYMWLSGWCTVCLLCLYQPFTELFFGEDMKFPISVVILFCMYFYVRKMGDIRGVYSEAKGLWWENRYRAIIESISNFVLNVFLGKYFGVHGIVAATLISLFFINFVWGSQIVYKYYFTEIKMTEYYLQHLFYASVTTVSCIITYYICTKIACEGFKKIIFISLICTIVPNVIYFIVYNRTRLYKSTVNWIKKM